MKKRFFQKENRNVAQTVIFSLLIAGAALFAVSVAAGGLSSRVDTRNLEFAENSVSRSVVLCYATEGVYPDNLEYLEKNYGLVLDRNLYIYHYESLGENLFPEIGVFRNPS